MIKKIERRIKKVLALLGIKKPYPSETSKVRHLVITYSKGYGCDIGFGGDKIVKENCVGIDYEKPYAYTGKDKVDIACDLVNEKIPLNDSLYDYVYSSHLIEDFVDTISVLREFIRILKPGGNLILVFPDQQEYEQVCIKNNQPINVHHVHKNMSMNFMLDKINEIKEISYEKIFSSNCEIDYNVILVLKIKKN